MWVSGVLCWTVKRSNPLAPYTSSRQDPNFPLYWDGLYHLFYQKHAAEPHANNDGKGPVIGHVISADMVHWAHLPVALWNDAAFDSVAIFTGSASVVDGTPTMVYPGICDPAVWAACAGHNINLAIAVPANASDPLLASWVKPPYSPIVNVSQRDPTTAWQTAAGEWRLTNYDGTVYASADFRAWRDAGPLFPAGECPDVYPLPPPCVGLPGCAGPPPPALLGPPTHVHKLSTGGQDYYWLGNLTDGAPGTPGGWAPSPGLSPRGQAVDGSAVAAAGSRPRTGVRLLSSHPHEAHARHKACDASFFPTATPSPASRGMRQNPFGTLPAAGG